MTTITICVGTSCYMKGSHHVIDRFDQLIRQHEFKHLKEGQAVSLDVRDMMVFEDDGLLESMLQIQT